MEKIIFSVITLAILSGCGIDSDDYFVRWWNGDITSELSPEEKKYGIFVIKKPNIYPATRRKKAKKPVWNI